MRPAGLVWSPAMSPSWRETRLWRETVATRETLAATLASADAESVAALLAGRGVRRVVATGNGAAYYAAVALWLAALECGSGPQVAAVPAGLLAGGRFRWREGDALLAFSTSGEMRDVIEALDAGAPTPFAAVTARPGSTIGSRAQAVGRVTIASQGAVTHTQGFCGNVAVALAAWALATGDAGLREAVHAVPEAFELALAEAEAWVESLVTARPAAAVVFGSGPAWAAALEGALLLKEVAGVPAEGVETREGATSAMYALAPGHLVVSLPTAGDRLVEEAEATCAARGATVVRAPGGAASDPRLAAITTFPALVALSAVLGVEGGLDVDRPAWTEAYYAVARSAP